MIEVLVECWLTRGKGDYVSLAVGQILDVPGPVESSMVASGLARIVVPVVAASEPEPIDVPIAKSPSATSESAKDKKGGGK
jgi:hypothetical protein